MRKNKTLTTFKVIYEYRPVEGGCYTFGVSIDAESYAAAQVAVRERMELDGMPMERIEFVQPKPLLSPQPLADLL